MPCKLKICHNYNKNERLCICKWWLYNYCIQERKLGLYLQKAIVSAGKKKKKEEIIFHADFPSEQEEQESSGDSQLEVKGGC